MNFRSIPLLLAIAVGGSDPTTELLAGPLAQYPNDLSNWMPRSSSEIASVTARCIRALYLFHSHLLAHGNVVSTSFVYTTTPMELRLREFKLHESTPEEIISELKQLFEISVALFAKADLEVPRELQLCLLKVRLQPYNHNLPLDLIDIVQRLYTPETPYALVQRYLTRLTLEETTLLTSETYGLPQDLSKCVPHWISAPGLSGSYLHTSRSTRPDGIVVTRATGVRNFVQGLEIHVSADAMVSIRESAVLDILRDPSLLAESIPTPKGVSVDCMQHVSGTLIHWTDLPLANSAKLTQAELTEFALAALRKLRLLHETGFVHGSIGIDSFVFVRGRLGRNMSKIKLVDFVYATPWVRPLANSARNEAEPLHAKSIFELEHELPNRLDDLFRLCELVFRLSGQPKFQPEADWDSDVLKSKRDSQLVEAVGFTTPIVVVIMYETIKEMQPHDVPKYAAWIRALELAVNT